MPRQKPQAPLRAEKLSEVAVEVRGDDIHFAFDTRNYRVRGLQKNYTAHQLRVSLLASRDGLAHLDTLDLCQARLRQSFVKAAAAELFIDEQTIKKDIGRVLLELERLQDERLQAELAEETKVELTARERQEALELLESPQLMDAVLADFEACGLVGEATGKLITYLACTSRRLKRPLAVLIQSGSAAGKTSLMDATLAFMPPEEQLRYSAMTSQSLYYMGRQNLKHKILAIAEEEGVEQASYALKLLQSDGRLRIAAAGKDSATGRQQTQTYSVEGPVAMLLTTTSEQPDAELESRCFVLHINECSRQTDSIQSLQRTVFTLGRQTEEARREAICQRHQNAQRLLEPLAVVMPWAEQLTFRSDQTRMRRDNAKYLSLIASITLLFQRQRVRRTIEVDGQPFPYVESSLDDLALANRLISDLMGQSLDGLLPQTRQLLALVDDHVSRRAVELELPRQRVRFTQRELREALGWGDFQLRKHLQRLVQLEYVAHYRTGQGNGREYELLYNGEGRKGQRFLLGLKDPAELVGPPPEGRLDRMAHETSPHSSPIRAPEVPPSLTSKNASNGKPAKSLRPR